MEYSKISSTKLIGRDEVLESIKKDEAAYKHFCQEDAQEAKEGRKYLKEMTYLARQVLEYAQIEAEKGNTSLRWGNWNWLKNGEVDFPNSLLRDSLMLADPVIVQIFRGLNMAVQIDYRGFNLSWNSNHPLLNPNAKPVFKAADVEPARDGYFYSLFKEENQFSDFKVSVEGRAISTHRVILAQCPYFKAMLTGDWNELEEKNFILEGHSYETFSALLEYLYTGKISDEKWIKDLSHALDLFRLADYLQYSPVKNLCKSTIFDRIDNDSFLSIALVQRMMPDSDIEELCSWFLKSNPHFGHGIDLSSLSILELALVFQVSDEYKIEPLRIDATGEIRKKLKLDNEFIELCQFTKQAKDNNLRSCLQNVLRSSETIVAELKKGKKDTFNKPWNAYKKMMSSLDF